MQRFDVSFFFFSNALQLSGKKKKTHRHWSKESTNSEACDLWCSQMEPFLESRPRSYNFLVRNAAILQSASVILSTCWKWLLASICVCADRVYRGRCSNSAFCRGKRVRDTVFAEILHPFNSLNSLHHHSASPCCSVPRQQLLHRYYH